MTWQLEEKTFSKRDLSPWRVCSCLKTRPFSKAMINNKVNKKSHIKSIKTWSLTNLANLFRSSLTLDSAMKPLMISCLSFVSISSLTKAGLTCY
jgi:hypothetical protein